MKRTEAIEALSHGREYLGTLLHDSKVWLDLIPKNIPRDEAISFLLTRIAAELSDYNHHQHHH